jgi:Flp pilus assembly secretin CpaC
MCQGLRGLVATLAAVLLLPGVRAGEPQPTIQCKICVVRVTDDGYDIMRTACVNGPKCCQACPSCPASGHTPCEQKCANGSCCDQACSRQKCGSEECCENHCHDVIVVPATMPCLIDSCMVQQLLDCFHGQANCEVMTAPRLLALNNQNAVVSIGNDQPFVTNVDSKSVGGHTMNFPVNEFFHTGFRMSVTPRMLGGAIMLNVDAQMTDLDAPNVPLFPVTSFIRPAYEAGAQGQPIAFTQFIQQPSFTTRGMHKIAACPVGKTVVLDCGRRTSTVEVQRGLKIPVLGDLPIVGEFFCSNSTETVSDHVLVFVTPTIMAAEAGEESSVETNAEVALPLFAMPVMCEEGRVTPVSNVEYLPNAPRPVTPPVPCQACPAQGCPTACPCPGACPCPSMTPPLVAAPKMPPPVVGGQGYFVFAQQGLVVQPYAVPVGGYVPPCAAPCPACPTQCAQATCPCPSCPTQCGQGAACPCPSQAPCENVANSSQVQLDMKLVFVSDEFFDRDGAGVWTRFAPTKPVGSTFFVGSDEVCRFVSDARAKGCARLLAEPRMVTLSGRPATFLSGGQTAVKSNDGEERFEPVGVQATLNPVVCGQYVQIGMELVQAQACEGQGVNSHTSGNVTAMMPWGRTMVRCVRSECAPGKPGEYLYVIATPKPVDPLPVPACQSTAVPPPSPAGAMPAAHAPCVAALTCATPMLAPPPCVAVAALTAAAPMPCVQSVAAVAPVPCHCPDLPLVHLMIEYHEASRCGDKARARNLAAQCIAIDPTCFSR